MKHAGTSVNKGFVIKALYRDVRVLSSVKHNKISTAVQLTFFVYQICNTANTFKINERDSLVERAYCMYYWSFLAHFSAVIRRTIIYIPDISLKKRPDWDQLWTCNE